MVILIDNGHGIDKPGKCSPDGALKEWAWAREIAQMLTEELCRRGYDARRIVTEDIDVPLRERTRRVNEICAAYGTANVCCVSIHINAAGADGKWHNATGWSVYVAPRSSDNSKRLARLLYAEAAKRGLQGNRSVPAAHYWTGNFAIVRDTKCPAVLTENLFMDNKAEAAWLMGATGKATIVSLHADGIINYMKEVNK